MKALITGVTGQDGSFLAELLLSKGYEVYGTIRKTVNKTYENIEHLLYEKHFHLVEYDLTDTSTPYYLIKENFDEIYNLAAQSFVPTSWSMPWYTLTVNTQAVASWLELIRLFSPETKFYQASTSEMFGASPSPQNELTPFRPLQPYAISKLSAHHLVENYRERYGLFAVSGILFNHESERRGTQFVTRKISHAVAQIACGVTDKLELGNMYPKRDWGHAKDYVNAMYLMMQHHEPDTFVVGTGEQHHIWEFVDLAFKEIGKDPSDFVKTKPHLQRKNEVIDLKADYTKIYKTLSWQPKIRFQDLVFLMVERDIWNVKHGIIKSL